MKVLLLLAMEDELKAYLTKVTFDVKIIDDIKVYHSLINNVDLYFAKSDIGKVNAAILATILINKIHPKYLINSGIAGGLNPNVKIYDVIASSKVSYHDFDLSAFGLPIGMMDNNIDGFKASEFLLDKLPSDVKRGLIVSGDKFVSGIENVKIINENFKKALACDMEGCAFAHAAYLHNIPFIVIRVISDNVYLANLHETYFQEFRNKAIEKACHYTLDLIKSL